MIADYSRLVIIKPSIKDKIANLKVKKSQTSYSIAIINTRTYRIPPRENG